MFRTKVCYLFFFVILFFIPIHAFAYGFNTVDNSTWSKTAVRKILHTFTYGGFASDEQIERWAKQSPDVAINEILTFDALNEKLSPSQDASALHADNLQTLQEFWSSTTLDNPVDTNQQSKFSLLATNAASKKYLSTTNLQNTWLQAVSTRGINSFPHKVAFFLTNYHMAISISKTRAALMRDFYDRTLEALRQDKDLFDVLAQGASSAAVSRAYGHAFNRFNNRTGKFFGNDDFAREFHQLYFKIQGNTETDPDYHENTTIENTAWALTGMRLDRSNDFASDDINDWSIAPINFTDHAYIDGNGNSVMLYNQTWHHQNYLEILHTRISGVSAEEKIQNLARVAGYHVESLANLPVFIIDFFADDNLDEFKKNQIREAWQLTEPKSLLSFLRSYAISDIFHSETTVKFRSAFDRNLLIYNLNTVDNQENFSRAESPKAQMQIEGATVFQPAHDVFGGQTGLQAANNPNIFKDAYKRNVTKNIFLGRASSEEGPALANPWEKDWAKLIPANDDGEYEVKDVAEWLWLRFIGDDGKNLQDLERAHIHALLAQGVDLGYALDPTNPDKSYGKEELDNDAIQAILETHETSLMTLNSDDVILRRSANTRIGLAVNFITITPFTFAGEGN
ncbi:MAG: hypothetical protein OEY38_16015 [Gammaproteobacteria bacterium]|nr:hypothetical protein [Gammaproteobacteria bacterium]